MRCPSCGRVWNSSIYRQGGVHVCPAPECGGMLVPVEDEAES
jgi:hypothetical protein